jgi:hypothetical protein
MKNNKGQIGIGSVLPFISIIVVATILIGVSQIVLDKFMQVGAPDNEVVNASLNDSIAALSEFGNWWDLVIIVLIAAVILGLIFLALMSRGGGM